MSICVVRNAHAADEAWPAGSVAWAEGMMRRNCSAVGKGERREGKRGINPSFAHSSFPNLPSFFSFSVLKISFGKMHLMPREQSCELPVGPRLETLSQARFDNVQDAITIIHCVENLKVLS